MLRLEEKQDWPEVLQFLDAGHDLLAPDKTELTTVYRKMENKVWRNQLSYFKSLLTVFVLSVVCYGFVLCRSLT